MSEPSAQLKLAQHMLSSLETKPTTLVHESEVSATLTKSQPPVHLSSSGFAVPERAKLALKLLK